MSVPARARKIASSAGQWFGKHRKEAELTTEIVVLLGSRAPGLAQQLPLVEPVQGQGVVRQVKPEEVVSEQEVQWADWQRLQSEQNANRRAQRSQETAATAQERARPQRSNAPQKQRTQTRGRTREPG